MRIELREAGLAKVAAAMAVALLAAACSSTGGSGTTKLASAPGSTASAADAAPVADPPPSSTSTTGASSTTSTTAAVQKDAVASAPKVLALQQRLAELGYDVGTPDGQMGARTSYAIMAFQKVEGLTRDGVDGPQVDAALATASKPGPMVPDGPPTRIEVDVARQVLFSWVDGSLARILPVSTGSGEHYCVDGACDVAVTPGGSFRIGRKAEGLEVGPLGELWWPMYFNGGIAIHGSPSVPAYPASHGCVRIPMYAAPTFYDQVGAGTRVIVLNSPEAPAPPDDAKPVPDAVAPPDTAPPAAAAPDTVPAPAPADTTTTTVAPPADTTTIGTTTTTAATVSTLPSASVP